jgi:formylglycine-generating enzyme required for sulfatase activity
MSRTLSLAGYSLGLLCVFVLASEVFLSPAARAFPQGSGARPAGTVQTNAQDGQKYVWIPAGTFTMGCSGPGRDDSCDPEEKRTHEVTLTKGFWLGQTPATVAAYQRFVAATKGSMPPAPDFNHGWTSADHPIVGVAWDDATNFCGWAGGRLPTEAEWEYAVRATAATARYGDLDAIAWYRANAGGATHAVAQKQANAFGLYDMLGNVFEWVSDWYAFYDVSLLQDPKGPPTGVNRVLRGSSWSSLPNIVRASHRGAVDPDRSFNDTGMRCVRETL